MTKITPNKPGGILITNLAEVKKFPSLAQYILQSFYGRDLTKTMNNTSLRYFTDMAQANELYQHFKEEICERVSFDETQARIEDDIREGIIAAEDRSYEINVQMTLEAIYSICAEIYCNEKRVNKNPGLLLADIFKENAPGQERG